MKPAHNNRPSGMTDSSTQTAAATATLSPSGLLLSLIVALLAPMFLGVTAGDVNLARMAAAETVNAYRSRNHADLIAIAQIIAFGLAALGSLSLSLADEISISMALRLRGNANACNRSAEQNRRALSGTDPAPPQPDKPSDHETQARYDDQLDAAIFLSAVAEQQLAEESEARLLPPEAKPAPVRLPAQAPAAQVRLPAQVPAAREPIAGQKRHQEMWAIAMAKEASEISAGIPNLPPAERHAATLRAAMLSSTAHDLVYGANTTPPRPGTPNGTTRPDVTNKPPRA